MRKINCNYQRKRSFKQIKMHKNVSIILSQTVKWTWTSHTELWGCTGHLELMAGPPVTETDNSGWAPRHHHKWRPYLLYSRNVNSFKWICYRIKIFLAGYIQIFLFIAARQWICLLFMVQVEETMRFSCSPSRYHITAQTLQRYICTWRGRAYVDIRELFDVQNIDIREILDVQNIDIR